MIDKAIIEQKKLLRKEIYRQKALFTNEEKEVQDKFVNSQILKHSKIKNAKTIMAYWAMPDEVDLTESILELHKEKTILLPIVTHDHLVIRKFDGLDSLQEGIAYGILEPTGELVEDYSSIDVVIVPGMAFDMEMNRMGRGKAYYDNFLVQTQAYKLAVCFDFQIVEKVPADKHDVKMDEVCTFK